MFKSFGPHLVKICSSYVNNRGADQYSLQIFIILGVQCRTVSVVSFFVFFLIIIFCFVVAIFYLAHDV